MDVNTDKLRILGCKTQQELDLCKALKRKHKERYGAQRIQIEAMRNVSERLPAEQMSIYADAMDNSKGYCCFCTLVIVFW